MQLAGQPAPFFQCRRLFRLLPQTLAFDGQSDLVGDTHRQMQILVREIALAAIVYRNRAIVLVLDNQRHRKNGPELHRHALHQAFLELRWHRFRRCAAGRLNQVGDNDGAARGYGAAGASLPDAQGHSSHILPVQPASRLDAEYAVLKAQDGSGVAME